MTGGAGGADEPTVSVVLPTYDRAATLPGAIESVLAQTHRPVELVVVDGGSTDDTDEVLEAVDDERLRVLRRESPAGPSAARNAGVRATDGEFVAFVDADDRWRPRKLERQFAAMERADAPVSLTGLEKSAGEPRTRGGAEGDVHGAVRRLEVPTYTSTLLASRDALADVGGFDESLGCFEDWELCLRLSREYGFTFVDDPLVEKGTNGDNVSADPDRLAAAFHALDRRYDLARSARVRLLADVGVTYFEAGRFAEGRPYAARSLALDVRRPKVAVALVLSLTGSPTAFDSAMERVYGAERLLHAAGLRLRRQLQATGR
ncbi:glycosyltransferase family 2 protein [Halorarum salinum]|uniref:Glycosyltransferase family 2 protein n=1 Tax=Halorarum salinum TaxID=2743089 RepID=A0A7D5QE23_9EURY|nr:glycosyltransferase family A protein [Halobaculum salinum]QLG60423.1 glycosyltransferase family 2 protein [Halobaculum salinum]